MRSLGACEGRNRSGAVIHFVHMALKIITLIVALGALALFLVVGPASLWERINVVSVTSDLGMHLRSVTVSGRYETSVPDLLSVLEVEQGEPFILVDISSAQPRLEALPWVRAATVHRYWPDRLHIDLVERTPIALWQDGDMFKPVDADGYVIDVPAESYANLFLVAGPGAPEAASDLLVTLSTQPQIMERVAAATRVGSRRWDLWLGEVGPGGIRVKLPEVNVEHTLQALAYLDQHHNLFGRSIDTIDMRLSERLVLRLAAREARRSESPAGTRHQKKSLKAHSTLSAGRRI